MTYIGPKIFFIDLDGTLIDEKSKTLISEENLQALYELKKYSHLVVSTGRSFNDHKVQEILSKIPSEFIICSSGAHIYEDKNLIKRDFFNQRTLGFIKDYAIKNKIPFVLFSDEHEDLIVYNKFHRWVAKKFWGKRVNVEICKESKAINKVGIVKIAFLTWPFKMKKLVKKINNDFHSVNTYTANGNWVLEITDKDTNKLSASIFIANKLGINIKETIHIGDSMSDSVTVGTVGKTIAMKNADKEFKDMADIIGPKNKKAGVARIINAILKRSIL
ncbi:HAD-IIB family hydrolase [Mycoplasma crocodyli]|uniref:COF family haloacid dehalogenase(HAD)-like hydrolase n=1 Tax=Mycoplasma crocodyli (strain ATCC 51981 / MP145) TaxID=512564 RepID=D5E4N0_MYCCM|nr:HAD-IIB family hydrolase [Mycoplasma crocodyli]ADE19457.1 COF family haloacid dehalogenase(HAD)-like hydrolase [Mycoplasma crocodyli MP145]